MCRLLGVPDTDIPVLVAWVDALSPVFVAMTPEQIAAATTAITELQRYVDELTTRRSKDPGRDLITALLASEADGERLTHGETVTMIANLLVAGHDTAGSQIPCSILVALQHRHELTGVHEDEARLANAVAETMRLEPSIPYIPRTAVAPIELYDTTIVPGSMVFLCIAAACRDASTWREPDHFDPDRFSRPDTPRLLNFGAGTLLRGPRPREDRGGRVSARCTRTGSPTAPDRGSGGHSVAPAAWPQPRPIGRQIRAGGLAAHARWTAAVTSHPRHHRGDQRRVRGRSGS
jgi:cytochrome P450